MRLEAFRTELPRAFDGDLAAPHPRDRRFRALLADVPGMATESKLALLSLAAAHLEPGEAYLEVGSFKGLSLIGAMLGNQHGRFYAIENFLEFNLDAGATRYELLLDLAAEREEDPRWWNGLRVYAFRRPPGAPAARRASIDLAWRLLAYELAYQPAMRLAWRTLPHHPRLASAVLKVVPMASRRVQGCG